MSELLSFTGFAGIRVAAEVSGGDDAPPVLLIHGGGQSRAIWRDVTAALVAAGRRVVAVDLRGHGDSEWPTDGRYDLPAFVGDLRAVLAQIDARPVVVASTIGGWIATVALGTDAANLVAGLVLVDLPTELDPEITTQVAARLRASLGDGTTAAWDERWLDGISAGDVPGALASAAPNIAVPTLVVRGAMSEVTSHERISAFVDLLPNAEFVEVPGAGRLLAEERADAFNALLLDFLERRQPRAAPEYRSGSDARTLRDALGCFATGVTIVTAVAADGRPIGLTANSFTSVSLEPPLLLVCIANGAGSAAALRDAACFAVNVLQIGQQPASNRFAGKGEDRFADIDWAPGEKGAPVLAGSLSAFECERFAVHEGGDHFILVGRVHKASFEPRRDPLLYFRGKYRRLHFA